MEYNIINDTRVITKAFKDWIKKPLNKRAWLHFKSHFRHTYTKYEEFNQDSYINQYTANMQYNMNEYAAITQS